ncbi:GntR family transcriptional regulator [Embleya sp. NBC_00896]|uniref:GntR family transcriptional regulator n=1 Tax=Embleya sp. NBC_00896 TaxID=2975961 RepID=UPI00386B431D|nr:GntR family transcriptional regulator [Embleya sp. NBC_00896]
MIDFHLDTRSGVSPYQQLVQQVRQALRLGMLSKDDQLPTVKEVVSKLAINPNTVLKAYRELEHEGLVTARPGVGTFVTRTLTDGSLAAHEPLRRELQTWLANARRAGLDADSIEALFTTTFRSTLRTTAEAQKTEEVRK